MDRVFDAIFPLMFAIAIAVGMRSFTTTISGVPERLNRAWAHVLPSGRVDRAPFFGAFAGCMALSILGIAGVLPSLMAFAVSFIVVMFARSIEMRGLGLRFDLESLRLRRFAIGLFAMAVVLSIGLWKGRPGPAWVIAAVAVIAALVIDAARVTPSLGPGIPEDLADQYVRRWIRAATGVEFSGCAVLLLIAVERASSSRDDGVILGCICAYFLTVASRGGFKLTQQQLAALAYDIPAQERAGLTTGPTV